MANPDRWLAALEDRHAQRTGCHDDEREERMARENDAYCKMLNCPDYQRVMAGLPPRGYVYDDEGRPVAVDEYGRTEDHPDYGYLGESLSVCLACKWQGDPLGSEFCPECHEQLEVQA